MLAGQKKMDFFPCKIMCNNLGNISVTMLSNVLLQLYSLVF